MTGASPGIYRANFHPAWWCRGGHLQTLLPFVTRKSPHLSYQRERVERDDGDFVDLDWLKPAVPDQAVQTTVILHGLEGSSSSHYVRGIAQRLVADLHHQIVVLNFRGCSGEPNRLHRRYHAGDTLDLSWLINRLQSQYPGHCINAVGYSLGGSVLLNWLSNPSCAKGINSASAICVPLSLDTAANKMNRGCSRLYQFWLINQMRLRLNRKYRFRKSPVDLSTLSPWDSFFQFDDRVTAPLHGFKNVDDYYRRCSAMQLLSRIKVPTLLIQSENDPMLGPLLPSPQQISNTVRVEVSGSGGHVGFVSGTVPWRPNYWLDGRLSAWLAETQPR